MFAHNNYSGEKNTTTRFCTALLQQRVNAQMKRRWMVALHSNELMISSEGWKSVSNSFRWMTDDFSVRCTIPPSGGRSWILENWPRLYRRKPQNWQNTCSYMRYPCRRRAKWSRTNFSSKHYIVFCFGFFSRCCCCRSVSVVVFPFLGSPKNQNLHAITASYTILHVFLFATIIYRT